MKTLNDALPHLSNASVFTKLDARSGYWKIKLPDKSSYLTTLNTPFGRYRYLRSLFELKAQDECQRKIDECFEGLPGVVALVDDILVYGQSREKHNRHVRQVLRRSREGGVKCSEGHVKGVSS